MQTIHVNSMSQNSKWELISNNKMWQHNICKTYISFLRENKSGELKFVGAERVGCCSEKINMTSAKVACGPRMACPLVKHSLTQAGDVGLSSRGRYDALSVAAGNVVINLSPRETEARLMEVAYRLVGHLWLLLFLFCG